MVEINKRLPLFSAGLVQILLLRMRGFFFLSRLFSVFAEVCCVLFHNLKSMISYFILHIF